MVLKHPDYYEGILQLRNSDDRILESAVAMVDKKENVEIAKVKGVKNGIDIYVTSKRFLRSLGNKLQQKFGGHLEVSRKLHTKDRQTSRKVYRVNVMLRIPDFKKGDVLKYKGDKVKVIGMSRKVLAKNLETGKKMKLSFKELSS